MAITRNTIGKASALGLGLFALSGAALADGVSVKDSPVDEGRKFSYALTIGATSDYIFRGFSQSAEEPAFQAAVDVSYGILYAGIWGSGIDFGDTVDETAEIDLYAGIKPVWGPLTFDFGVIYYWYPHTTDNPEIDYVELKAGVSATPVNNLAVGATLYWTPDNTGETGEVTTIEGTAGYTLPQVWVFTPTIGGTLGSAFAEKDIFGGGDDYVYWNAGIALAVEKFTFDFRYWDTDLNDATCNGPVFQCDERFVFSAKVVLP